jgi:hypothetical protein
MHALNSNKMDTKNNFTIGEIALWGTLGKVELPNVQRGFVWRPYQIENFLDSLLRGYPIGSFVLSPKTKSSYMLLDGQQRATSIALAFGQDTFRDKMKSDTSNDNTTSTRGSKEYFKVFIDLRSDRVESRNFVFRVITKSHPWGYQKKDNEKKLPSHLISEAIKAVNGGDLVVKLDQFIPERWSSFFPYDAKLPVEFSAFFEHTENEQLKLLEVAAIKKNIEESESFKAWQKYKIGQQIQSKDEEYIQTIRVALEKILKNSIPAIYLHLEEVAENSPNNNKGDNQEDDIENLFVRLNSGGTPISGEELVYSMLKSKLSGDQQQLIYDIEEMCAQTKLMKPSRFITLAYRLYPFLNGSPKDNAPSMRIKPKQFQIDIKNEDSKFTEFLGNLCYKKISDTSGGSIGLLELIKSLLAYDAKTKNYGLPFLSYSKLAESAPELMFILMYRILKGKDTHLFKNEEGNRKLLGALTILWWFGRHGSSRRNHEKVLRSIWESKDQDDFWSFSMLQKCDFFHPNANNTNNSIQFPRQDYFSKELKDYTDDQIDENLKLDLYLSNQNDSTKDFLRYLIYNRDIILYAQRFFIDNYFSLDRFASEDSNLPFDWDHIVAESYIQNKPNIYDFRRNAHSSIGNLRAWPYEWNRSDQDKSPLKKFEDIDLGQFLADHDALQNKSLLQLSFCEAAWKKCKVGSDEIRANVWDDSLRLITQRTVLLIKEWYEQLRIAELTQWPISSAPPSNA